MDISLMEPEVGITSWLLYFIVHNNTLVVFKRNLEKDKLIFQSKVKFHHSLSSTIYDPKLLSNVIAQSLDELNEKIILENQEASIVINDELLSHSLIINSVKDDIKLVADEIVDSSVMNVKALRKFYADEMEKAKSEGILLSLHVKTTMMRISDPIIFGHCVSVYYESVLNKYAKELTKPYSEWVYSHNQFFLKYGMVSNGLSLFFLSDFSY